MPEALKSRVSVPGSPTVVLYVFAVGFQGQVFWELVSSVQDLGAGVPDVEHRTLASL